MKILHVTGEFPPYILGGLGTFTYEICKRLAYKGHEVDVVVIRGNTNVYKYENLPIPSEINVIVKNFDARKFSKFKNGLFDVDIIEKELDVYIPHRMPDIVHVHDWYGVLWAAVCKYKYDLPIVMSSHLPLRSGFTYSGHPIPLKIKMRLEALGFRIADKIITPSNFIADVIVTEYNVPKDKICIIPNGIDTNYFYPKKKKLNENEKVILSVSRMTEQKGPEYLLDLAKIIVNNLQDIKFLIIGDGPMLGKIKKFSKEIDGNIEILGFVPREDLLKYYNEADIFVSTSVYEPFGLVILEAMASGNPIVAFSIGGIKEIVRNGIDGFLVPPCRIDLMAQKIIDLLTNPKLRIKLGGNAKARAKQFDWRNTISTIENIYKIVTEGV